MIQRPPSQHIVPGDVHEREVAQDGDDARLGDVLPEVRKFGVRMRCSGRRAERKMVEGGREEGERGE